MKRYPVAFLADRLIVVTMLFQTQNPCLMIPRAKSIPYSTTVKIVLVSNQLNCLFSGLVPVPIRPPNFHNVVTTLPTVKMIVEVSKSVAIMTTVPLFKLLRSKEAQTVVEARQWPAIITTEDLAKKKLSPSYRPSSADMTAYLDFSVSTTGMLAGVKVLLTFA